VWWISYRGESGHGVDNIGVFEDDGSPRKTHPLLLDPSPAAQPLHIARGFALVGDDLYIANAWRKDSHIALYHRHGDTFRFKEVLAKTAQVAAMVHPFDVELGDDGRVYVSCQDTNTVVSLVPETREPAPVAAHLLKHYPAGKFLPGTLVASSRGSLPEYGDHTPPIGELKARVVIKEKLDAPSGFAIGPDGDFYVAERKKQRVRRFSSDGKKEGTFIHNLPDMPEFVVYVP
jgi:hypothetical protein